MIQLSKWTRLALPNVFALAVLLAALVVWTVRPARAQGITFIPPEPTIADSVKVMVGNGFSSGCWTIRDRACQTPAPDSLKLVVQISYCSACQFCPTNAPTYLETCNFGLLSAGTHTFVLSELHSNPADPLPTIWRPVTFTVLAATPTLRRSWGAVKSIYR
jgi:hypothetical protein